MYFLSVLPQFSCICCSSGTWLLLSTNPERQMGTCSTEPVKYNWFDPYSSWLLVFPKGALSVFSMAPPGRFSAENFDYIGFSTAMCNGTILYFTETWEDSQGQRWVNFLSLHPSISHVAFGCKPRISIGSRVGDFCSLRSTVLQFSKASSSNLGRGFWFSSEHLWDRLVD